MKKTIIRLKCPHCENEFDGSLEQDNLGWHSSCPRCEGSFDVDIPEKYAPFTFDEEKIEDMFLLSKEEFLKSYSYLTEESYNLTIEEIEFILKDWWNP